MFLSRFTARNFRLLQDFGLDFSDPITVLIGPNNAGKSNVVDALLLLSEAMQGMVARDFLSRRRGFERVVTGHDAERVIELKLQGRLGDQPFDYSLSFDRRGLTTESASGDGWEYRASLESDGSTWRAMIGDGTSATELASRGGSPAEFRALHGDPAQAQPMQEFIAALWHIDPFRAVDSQYQVGAKTRVAPAGVDLAQVLHYNYSNDRERFDAFEEMAQSVLPEIDLIETPITEGTAATVRIRFLDDPGKYDLWQLSSGVKDAMILLAAIHFSEPGQLILLEEPENHLHPASQKALCGVLKSAADDGSKQFIVTTHSETILGQFAPSEVVFISKQEARAVAQPLDEADIFQVWQSLGIERSILLQILGRRRQVVVIVEGRVDYQVLDGLWDEFDLRDKVLPAVANGGGWREIVDSAASLRDALARFRIPSSVFVLLDNDGERDQKMPHLEANHFSTDDSHVWEEKEVESYLLLPDALASISSKSVDEVRAAIDAAPSRGKEKLDRVLRELGIAKTPPHVIVTNVVGRDLSELPEELRDVPRRIRKLLGMNAA